MHAILVFRFFLFLKWCNAPYPAFFFVCLPGNLTIFTVKSNIPYCLFSESKKRNLPSWLPNFIKL